MNNAIKRSIKEATFLITN